MSQNMSDNLPGGDATPTNSSSPLRAGQPAQGNPVERINNVEQRVADAARYARSGPTRGPANGVARPPSPETTYASVDRLVTLIQQISELLDGSLESLTNATESLAKTPALLNTSTGEVIHSELSSAAEKLEKISELVHGAMQGRGLPLGSPLLSKARPISLREAIEHAIDVLAPMLDRNEIDVRVQIPDHVAGTPAGALYTVILNGLQNATESIERRKGPGCITVTVRKETAPKLGGYGKDSREWQTIEIIDDGEGPPATSDPSRVFDLGYTTKPRGTGVGLAVARSVVQSMGGSIELFPNLDRAPVGKRGAVLRARYPSPDAILNVRLGGAA